MLGARLRQVREGKGITQKELAARINVDTNTVWRWEQDRTELGVTSLLKIAQALDVQPSVLLDEIPAGKVHKEGVSEETLSEKVHEEDDLEEKIVFEWSDGAGGTLRVVLPPTAETYAFLERKLSAISGGAQSPERSHGDGGEASAC